MAVTGRIGSLSLVNDTLRDVAASQTRLSELQNQISSGYKSRDYAGLDGSVEQFVQVNGQLDRAAQFRKNNQLNISRLQTADVSLVKLIDITDTIKNTITSTTGASLRTSNLEQVIGDLLRSFGSELNTTFNGHYIFGGTDTTTPPVPSTEIANLVPGMPDDNYYVGSKENMLMRADDRTDITFPVRADDLAFQKIYAAARQAINAAIYEDPNSLEEARQLIQDGQRDLNAARAQLGGVMLNIQTVDDRLSALSTHWKQLTDSVSKTDIVAASTEVAGYQAILQATFQVYARLSQLRLADYLK